MKKEILWYLQNDALRNPSEIVGSQALTSFVLAQSLKYKADPAFVKLLSKLKLGLVVSREYENLVIHLSAKNDKLKQSFLCLPHPSGIAVNHNSKMLFLASSRNPNYILEMSYNNEFSKRSDNKGDTFSTHILMPSRQKFMSGSSYLHDLAIIDNKLYANSVGINGVVEIDFNSISNPKTVWQANAKTIVDLTQCNYLQLNSIAAGKTIEESFFTASTEFPQKHQPGSMDFMVEDQGVIFSAKSKEVICRGLTRPHSARFYKDKIWVCNSGHGNVGQAVDGWFKPEFKPPGWTRGLFFYKNYMFVGVSRILPKFEKYAPGVDLKDQNCGIYAFDLEDKNFIGKIHFPHGNQIFAIEGISTDECDGFSSTKLNQTDQKEINSYYKFKIKTNEH